MIDVWVWTKGKHSRPLKTIRFQMDHFPSEEECDRYVKICFSALCSRY